MKLVFNNNRLGEICRKVIIHKRILFNCDVWMCQCHSECHFGDPDSPCSDCVRIYPDWTAWHVVTFMPFNPRYSPTVLHTDTVAYSVVCQHSEGVAETHISTVWYQWKHTHVISFNPLCQIKTLCWFICIRVGIVQHWNDNVEAIYYSDKGLSVVLKAAWPMFSIIILNQQLHYEISALVCVNKITHLPPVAEWHDE